MVKGGKVENYPDLLFSGGFFSYFLSKLRMASSRSLFVEHFSLMARIFIRRSNSPSSVVVNCSLLAIATYTFKK